MSTNIGTLEGCDILLTVTDGKEIVEFTAKFAVDCDGSGGNPHHDPCFQPDTRYHHNGKALNAERVPYIVVPPLILAKTKGKVLGSHCVVTNLHTNLKSCAVVGDSGPSKKIGEGSPALAERIGLDGNPNHGGTDKHIIHYQIFVGVPAEVVGITYQPQSA